MQVALTIFIFGMFCIYVVWDCDRQRQLFRHTHGKCRIWGRIPTKVRQTACRETNTEVY